MNNEMGSLITCSRKVG